MSKNWYRNQGIAVTPQMSLNTQLAAAGLDWTVQLSPFRYGPDFKYQDRDRKIAHRSDNGLMLDLYTKRKPFQNRQVIEAFHQFCADTGEDIRINRLGCLDGGRTIFATAKMPVQIDVKKVGDITEVHLLLIEKHISGHSTQVRTYFNRLTCTNGETEQIRCADFHLNHVGDFSGDAVNAFLQEALNSVDRYGQTAEQLAEVSISDAEARMHLVKAFGDLEQDFDQQPQAVQTCYKLFKGQGQGSEYLSAFGTAYGLNEAVKEYENWHRRSSSLERAFSSVALGSRGKRQADFRKQLVSVHL